MRRVTMSAVASALCALSLAAGVRTAWAMGDADRVDVGLLTIAGPPTQDDLSAIERLAWELEKRTSLTVAPQAVALAPTDPTLRRHPFLVLHGAGPLPPLPERALDALRAHLEAGGLLFIDSAESGELSAEEPFDRDVRALVRRLFPRGALARLGPEHVLYKTFYLLGGARGRRARAPYLEALTIDGRVAIVYSRNDVLGALARDRLGSFAHPVEPGGEPQREQALRLGINVVMYALCLDYKNDQVHVEQLLKRRRGLSP
jgi:hypothetical protein